MSQAKFTPKDIQAQKERVYMDLAVKIRLDNAEHRFTGAIEERPHEP